jgi:glycosyltransferase involved in cell wall biosynthesis
VHVLLLASWYRTPRLPVVGSFIEEQARALMAEGCRVGIVHAVLRPFGARLDRSLEAQPPDEVDRGLPILRAWCTSPVPRLQAAGHAWLARTTLDAIERYAAAHGMPDVLHAHATFDGGVAGTLVARRLRRPLVLTEHLSSIVDPAWPPRAADARVLARTFALADRAIVVSGALRDALRRFGIDLSRVDVVPNLVAPAFFEDVGPPPPGPAFFSVSHLTERKRMDLLMKAFGVAFRDEPRATLRIGGDGPDRPRLETVAKDLGLLGRVALLGGLSREQVRDEMRRCRVFALASSHETFGVVVAEALACGRPVVVTDSLGVRDVVSAGDGLLVRESGADALAGALRSVLRLGFDERDVSRRALERFGPATIAKRLLAIYREVGRSVSRP